MGLRVGELARRTGVGVSTLRAWEARYRFPTPQRSAGGQRTYEEADVERIEGVLRLISAEGLTLPAAIARVASVGSAALPAGESEALLYNQILQAVGQGIWVIRDGRTRYVNRRMAEIMRCSIDELVEMPIMEVMPADELPLVRERTKKVRDGHHLHFTQELSRADGTTFLAEVKTTPLINHAGRYEGAVALVEDITERERLDLDLQKRDQQAETIALLIGQALRPRPDRVAAAASVTSEAVEAARRLLLADEAMVLEVDARTNELRVHTSAPPLDATITLPEGRRSFAGYVALARGVVLVEDATSDPRFDAVATRPEAPTISAIGAPIVGAAGLLGVLVANSRVPARFDPGDGHFLQGLAHLIAADWTAAGE